MTSKIDLAATPQSFFHAHVVEALTRLRLSTGTWTEFYLVDLLARKAPRVPLDRPLVFQLEACLSSPAPFVRFESYRTLGDVALLLAGFFSDFLSQRGVSQSYVASIGSDAYRATAALSGAYDGLTEAYEALSGGFLEFVRVLDVVREETDLRTPQDILAFYNQWKAVESPSTAEGLYLSGRLFVPRPDDEN